MRDARRSRARPARRPEELPVEAFALNRGFVYRDRARRRRDRVTARTAARPRPPLALSSAEQDLLLGLLDSERFADVAPATVFATLLDEGRYHGSIRTMYRLLAAQQSNRRAPSSANSSALRQARAPRDPAQRGVVLGHHQVEGSGQMDLLPSLRDPRHLQPLRRRLAARSSRVRGTRRAAHRRHPGEGKHRSRAPLRSMPIAAPACDRSPSPRS